MEEESYPVEIIEQTEIPGEIQKKVFLIVVLTQGVAFVIALIWGSLRSIFWWKTICFNGKSLLWGALLGLALALLNLIVYNQGKKISFTHFGWILEKLMYPMFRSIRIHEIFIIAFLSGFCEESLFRGTIQKEWGIIVASLIFGLLHTGARRLIVMGIWTALLGMILGFAYEKTGNLLIPMIAHLTNNLVNLIYLRYFHKPEGTGIAEPGGGNDLPADE